MNGEYIRKIKSEKLITFIYEFYNKQYPEKQIRNVLPLLVERMKTLAEFETLAGFFFVRPKAFERPLNKEILEVGRKALEASAWTHEAMEQSIRYVAQAAKLKAKDVFMELRVAVTGKTVGPPLLESLEILGKEETFTRIPSSEDR
jgi:glutamyl/glutaminyl-tRNA synthetase